MKRHYGVKTCLQCGKEFAATGNQQRYCVDCSPELLRNKACERSMKWRVAHKAERVMGYEVARCQKCGQEYVPTGGGQKYCIMCGVEMALQGNKRRVMKFNLTHPEQHYTENREQMSARTKSWALEHPEQVRLIRKKAKAKHRLLGFIPLNSWFEGCEGHHVDTEHVIYTPKELHQSIKHNIWTGHNMAAINAVAFAYMNHS